MNTVSLQAAKRERFGKGVARKLRAQGKVPGVIYRDGKQPLHIAIDPAELRGLFRRSQNINTIIEVDVEGDKRVVLLKDHDVHPVSRDVLHVDFFEVDPQRPVVVKVLVDVQGRAKGTVVGGKLELLRRSLQVRCLPENIPASVPVDVTELDLGDMMRVSAIPRPEGCEILFDQDFNVLRVAGRRAAAAPSAG